MANSRLQREFEPVLRYSDYRWSNYIRSKKSSPLVVSLFLPVGVAVVLDGLGDAPLRAHGHHHVGIGLILPNQGPHAT